jgi:hypothetical protein
LDLMVNLWCELQNLYGEIMGDDCIVVFYCF